MHSDHFEAGELPDEISPRPTLLSKITEGSNEERTEVSSAFFSAISSKCLSKPSKCLDGKGGWRSSGCAEKIRGNLPTPARAAAKHIETTDLRVVVKVFVESAVRGCIVEALCDNGQARSVIFRLSRRVDAFELTPCEGGASCKVRLEDVVRTWLGNEAWVQHELGSRLQGLDETCAVVECSDGRCLTLHFHGGNQCGGAEEAMNFVRCMQAFVSELHHQIETR
jgi:hypothetical protein